ncbi:hypothetical protein CsatB_023887 [Cannabis sativa]
MEKIGGAIKLQHKEASIGEGQMEPRSTGIHNIPRHNFVLWIAIQDRLQTRERLEKHNIILDGCCLFCRSQTETMEHRFLTCSFPLVYLKQMKCCLDWGAESSSLCKLMRWVDRAKISRFGKLVLAAATATLVYHLWHARNDIL